MPYKHYLANWPRVPLTRLPVPFTPGRINFAEVVSHLEFEAQKNGSPLPTKLPVEHNRRKEDKKP